MNRRRRNSPASAGGKLALVALGVISGCKSSDHPLRRGEPTPFTCQSPNTPPSTPIHLVSLERPIDDDTLVTGQRGADPFDGKPELDVESLVAEVERRNPSIQAMVAAWQAAAERYPQVISLDDPMFGVMLGPATFGSNDVDFGWMVEASQKVPGPGKRHWRGHVAAAQADAAYYGVEEAKLRLAEVAKVAYFDYFVVRRQRDINAENVGIMQEFRNIARSKYESNLVTQQDLLQTDVELAELRRRQIELERLDEVARARLNTLLHRVPDHRLPDPARQIEIDGELPDAGELRTQALAHRPDLAAQAAQIRAEEAAVELACKEFCPDLEFVARYDSFWQPAERDVRPQIGVNLNLPLQQERRRAAVREAVARVTQRRAELEQRVDEIQYEVQTGLARVNESRRITKLYAETILPAATENAQSAQTNYEANKLDFLRLIEAQRQLITHREKQYEAIADYHRRMAELERVVGGAIGKNQGVGSRQ
jgi:cobalt-zinc-cadmium efflux system outer membrane protein